MTRSPENNALTNGEQEDDGSWVNAELLEEILGQNTEVLDIAAHRATSKGDNFLSILYRTCVKYRIHNSDDVQVRNLIVKGLPAGEFLQTYIKELNVFGREILAYEKLNDLYEFADSRLLDHSFNRFSVKNYKTSRPDTLILDDLKPLGFIMASRRDRLDFSHAKLVVQNIARLHALSVAYTEEHPDFLSLFEDTVYSNVNKERLSQFFLPIFKSIVEVVRTWDGFSETADKLEGKGDIFVDKLIELSNPQNAFKKVLIHGDCWVNNMLFKYSETGEPIDLRFVDFQITRESSPAMDLHYFFYSSLQKPVRQNHWDDLLRVYCDEFNRVAWELGYKGSTISFEGISQEMNRTVFFGFCCTVMIAAVVGADPEDSPDMSTITEEQMKEGDLQGFNKMYSSPAFRHEFQDQLPYFDKLGLFD